MTEPITGYKLPVVICEKEHKKATGMSEPVAVIYVEEGCYQLQGALIDRCCVKGTCAW